MEKQIPQNLDIILHQGRSLQLRRVLPDDAPLLMAKMYSNPEFMRLFRLNDTPNQAQLRTQIERRLQTPMAQTYYLDLAIVHNQHGVIGLTALADYAPLHRRAEFLIGLFEQSYRHASYGLEASLMMLDLAFNQYRLYRVYAYTYEYNEFAQKGLLSLGFQPEGIQVHHVFDQHSQQFVSLCGFGLLLEQFRNNQRLVPLSQRLLGRDITQIPPPIPTQKPKVSPQGRKVPSSYRRSGNIVWRAPP